MTAGNREDLPNARMQVDRANADDFGGQIGRATQGLADAGLQLASGPSTPPKRSRSRTAEPRKRSRISTSNRMRTRG